MVVPDELAAIAREIDGLNLSYAFTGSIASTHWGRPRATYDADVLIALRPDDVDSLMRAFGPPEWHLDRETIVEALRGGEFNAIQVATGT